MTHSISRTARCIATSTILASGLALLASCGGSPGPADTGTPGPADSGQQQDGGQSDAGPPGSPDGGSGLQVMFTAPPAAVQYVKGSVSLQLVVLGGTPDQLELWKDGSILAMLPPPYAYTWDTSVETEADHTFEARAIVGGVTAGSAMRTFTVDRTPPTIVSRTPAAGSTTASLAAPVQVEFSEAILATSATDALSVSVSSGPLPATVAQPDPTVISAQPTMGPASLPATATATVLGTVTDLAGNALGADDTWMFTYPEWALRAGSGIGSGNFILDATLASDGTVWVLYGTTDLHLAKYDDTGWHELPSPRSGLRSLYGGRVRVRASGVPVVAWIAEFDTATSTAEEVRASEWGGSSWVAYAAPPGGDGGQFLDMEIEADGNVVLSWWKTTGPYSVQRYDGTWSTVGDALSATSGDATDLLSTPDGLYFSYVSNDTCHVAMESGSTWSDYGSPYTGTSYANTCRGARLVWVPPASGASAATIYAFYNVERISTTITDSTGLVATTNGLSWRIPWSFPVSVTLPQNWLDVTPTSAGWWALGHRFGPSTRDGIIDQTYGELSAEVDSAFRVLPGPSSPIVVTTDGSILDPNHVP